MSTNTDGAIRALRTVVQFATGMASYHHRSPFSRLPGGPRLLRAARRLARAKATGIALSFTHQHATGLLP